MLDCISCISVLRGNFVGFNIYSLGNLGFFLEGISWVMLSFWWGRGLKGGG